MRIVIGLLCAAVLMAGCANRKTAVPEGVVQALPGKPVVTPDFRSTGSVIMVNQQTRYVIVNFPVTNVPVAGSRLSVYRNGLKVGELKVTGPAQGGNTVADLMTGEAQLKDEARED